jgi:SAM-dependent methyltransferase
MLGHAAALVEELVESRGLDRQSQVVEIASNDGYLLRHYQQHGIPVLGIEPARNIAEAARRDGIPTLCRFFDAELAHQLVREGKRADVVHAHNVLAHVADLDGFVRGIEVLLKRDGIAVVEVPYVRDLVERCEFDTIYHEHLCYFSLTSLAALFSPRGLSIVHVERVPIHGGSLRLHIAPGQQLADRSVDLLLAEVVDWGVRRLDPYLAFAGRVDRLRQELREFLEHLKGQGKRIAAYGASAKGSTLLNSIGIGSETLDFVVDRSPVKQGRYTPGTRLPIYAPGKLLEEMPDYVLLLTWNFTDEIIGQQREYLERGGRFIIPIPEVRVLGMQEARAA